jgi:hypothetical protein
MIFGLKIQDIIYLLFLIFVFINKKYNYLVSSGLVMLIIAIPLYYFWIFFTAQRLVMYAAFNFLVYIMYILSKEMIRKEKL